jgi:hypothetical protein
MRREEIGYPSRLTDLHGRKNNLMQISSFEELAKYLREFRTWDNRGGYDFTGIAHLLGACLDNLRTHASKEELDDLPKVLEKHQLSFLNRIIGKEDGENLF